MQNKLIKLLQLSTAVLLITVFIMFVAIPAPTSAQTATPTIPPPPAVPTTGAPIVPQNASSSMLFLTMTLDFLGQGPFLNLVNLQPQNQPFRNGNACIYPSGANASSDVSCLNGLTTAIGLQLMWSPTSSNTWKNNNAAGIVIPNRKDGLPWGTNSYKVCVKIPTYLRNCQEKSIMASTEISMRLQYPGDSNNDNMINGLDYNPVYECFGKTTASPNCGHEGADLNGDGINDSLAQGNVKDLRIYLYGWGQSGQ
ncbi:MAG: dockerin type I domain-containing protein [Candidatus Levyibacteriota bacterium]